ncbi:MAG: DUF262 domain-containing protein [Hyphomicrobium sp.]|jgi:hypothetical protein
MNVSLTQLTVADLCDSLKRGDVTVNTDYQRTPRVWPDAARSFLIETILLGYPIPKLYLAQLTDVKTRQTRKEIVDGQQRATAIAEFLAGGFRLSRKSLPDSAAGKAFEELDDELKGRFLAYSLTADLIIGATNEDIREVFRRMNSYTVPLNAEEKRHAEFQGDFKWFIYRMSKRFAQALEDAGVFSEKALARMADAKLLTEYCHAVMFGITTTSAAVLRRLYAENDKDFSNEKQIERLVVTALDELIDLSGIHNSPLMKPHQAYSLLLALAHSKMGIRSLDGDYSFAGTRRPKRQVQLENLAILSEALDDPDDAPRRLRTFLEASEERTNVADQRQTRFKWYCRALDNKLRA